MENTKLKTILDNHKLWLLSGGKEGMKANLRGVDLSYVNLSCVNLSSVNLGCANLSCAILSSAILNSANLSGANLYDADLSYADFKEVNLDYSCLPLSCKGLNMNIDDRLAYQFLYHTLQNISTSKNTSTELKKALMTKEIVSLANKFHRAEECGLLKEFKEVSE